MATPFKSRPLSDQLVFLIPAKIELELQLELEKLIRFYGGEIVKDPKDASLIMTALTSLNRISRHIALSENKTPIVSHQWLLSLAKRPGLDMNDFLLRVPHDYLSPKRTNVRATSSLTPRSTSIRPAKCFRNTDMKTSTSLDTSQWQFMEEEIPSEDDIENGTELIPGYLNSKYCCLRKTPLTSKYNQELINELSVIMKARLAEDNKRSALAYQHAIAALKAYPAPIRSHMEAAKMKGIGLKISTMIQEFLRKDFITEARQLDEDQRIKCLQDFQSLYGTGPHLAKKWYDRGYRTLEDVLESDEKLTKQQQLWITHHDDLKQKMTRIECEDILNAIETSLREMEPDIIFTPTGGYRRGKELNGDLDLIISHQDDAKHIGLIERVVEQLKQADLLQDVLLLSNSEAKPLHKVLSLVKQPQTGTFRQVDIIVVNRSSYACALLGWTGSQLFERSIRLYATERRNMKLDSEYLLDLSTNTVIPTCHEKDIFSALGIDYLDPEYRNC